MKERTHILPVLASLPGATFPLGVDLRAASFPVGARPNIVVIFDDDHPAHAETVQSLRTALQAGWCAARPGGPSQTNSLLKW